MAGTAAGRETIDSRLLGSTRWLSVERRELVEDWAEGRVRDSFFMFREVRGLLGLGKTNESESEVADESPAEPSL